MRVQSDDIAVVRFAGEYDISNRSAVRAAFQGVAERPLVIADLTGVQAIDSTTIAELLRASRRASDLGGALVIVNDSPRVTRLLSIAGVTATVALADTQADARALLRSTTA